jgi:hypothetical protein
MIHEYRDRAQAAGDRLDREGGNLASCLAALEAAWAIPRFPQLASLHAGLLLKVLESPALEAAPGLLAEAVVLLVRVALLGAAGEVAAWAADLAEERSAAGGDRWKAAAHQARAMVLADQGRLPGARAERDAARALGVPVPAFEGPLEAALRWADGDAAGAARTLAESAAALPPSPDWDGDRYDAAMKRALAALHDDREAEAREACEEAWRLARAHGCVVDAGTMVLTLVPMLLAGGEPARARGLLEETLAAAAGADEEAAAALEMPARNLMFQALEAEGRPADALRLGFESLRRAAAVGSAMDYASTAVSMAAVYHRLGASPDALNLLRATEDGLKARPDAGDAADALDAVGEALSALRVDVGDAGWEALQREVERRRAAEAGR